MEANCAFYESCPSQKDADPNPGDRKDSDQRNPIVQKDTDPDSGGRKDPNPGTGDQQVPDLDGGDADPDPGDSGSDSRSLQVESI